MNSISNLNNALLAGSIRSTTQRQLSAISPITPVVEKNDQNPAATIQALKQYSKNMAELNGNTFNENYKDEKVSYSSSAAINLYRRHENLELIENTEKLLSLSIYA